MAEDFTMTLVFKAMTSLYRNWSREQRDLFAKKLCCAKTEDNPDITTALTIYENWSKKDQNLFLAETNRIDEDERKRLYETILKAFKKEAKKYGWCKIEYNYWRKKINFDQTVYFRLTLDNIIFHIEVDIGWSKTYVDHSKIFSLEEWKEALELV